MGPLNRWFSRKKKNKDPQQSCGAFSSTPTLDLVTHAPRSDPHQPSFSYPIVNPSGPSINTGSSDFRRPVLRVGQVEQDVGSDRWKQQLLAWRLSTYEDARKWAMIDADTHKILRHHAFLTPPPAASSRPTQSAPARSQAFPITASRPAPPSPIKTPTSPLPPSSWSRTPLKTTQDGSSNQIPSSLTLGSFLSIPDSPRRPRSRLRTSRSVTSNTSTLGDDQSISQPKSKKKEGLRDSFIARLQLLPSAQIPPVEDDLELLSRVKREMLTDDSPTLVLRAEWERTRAEMRVVCGSGGLEGVVDKIARETMGWREKCGVVQDVSDEDLAVELSRLRGMIEALAIKDGSRNLVTQNTHRRSVGSAITELSILDHPTSIALADFPRQSKATTPATGNVHLRPPVQPHIRRTPSQLSGKSGQSFFSNLSRKSSGLGGRFGSNKGIQVSSPIAPMPSIINHHAVDHSRPPAHEEAPPPRQHAESNSADELLRLLDLKQLEGSLRRLIEETEKLGKVSAGYEERIELLQVKVRAAELRDQLVGH